MNKKENRDEIRAKQYLQTLKYTKLEYEPLGNVTPDFLLDNANETVWVSCSIPTSFTNAISVALI